jgi:hypothetical protein
MKDVDISEIAVLVFVVALGLSTLIIAIALAHVFWTYTN